MEDEDIVKTKKMIKEITEKIVEHYKAIERLREEDRKRWREYTQRIEELENLKSQRGKKRRYRKKKDGTKEPDGSGCDEEGKALDKTPASPAAVKTTQKTADE